MAIDQAKTDIVRCHKQLGVAYYEGQSLAKDSMTLRDQFSLLDSERRAVAAKRTERVESLREVLSLVKKLNNALGDGARTEEVSANDSDLTMARFDRLTHADVNRHIERHMGASWRAARTLVMVAPSAPATEGAAPITPGA